LLGTYARLKEQNIRPVLCTDSGAQTAIYYEDPDRNSVELNVDNYGDSLTSTEHLRTSPEFAKNPMGKYVDPDKAIAAREAGASPWELHERAWTGEFAPESRMIPGSFSKQNQPRRAKRHFGQISTRKVPLLMREPNAHNRPSRVFSQLTNYLRDLSADRTPP
jgi:hypothetical protein